MKCKKLDGTKIKHIYYTVPNGNRTQNDKDLIANFDIIYKILKENPDFSMVKNIIILSNNTCNYLANIFYVAILDVKKSHKFNLLISIHNKLQDGKTDLDASFYYIKIYISIVDTLEILS